MTDHTNQLPEDTAPATVSDEQLLDLYLTAWVAGGIDVTMTTLPKSAADHIVGCGACTETAISHIRARLVQHLEDPVARHEVVDVCRAVLVREHRAPKFINVVRKAGQ